jgi:hypothetical protein
MLLYGGAIAAAVAIVSCSGVPSSPEGVAKKMLRAHGGPAKLARLDTFIGRGFIKDLTSQAVSKSFPFDVYRKGKLYKHKIMSAPEGKLTDVIVIYFDGTVSREWSNRGGTKPIPSMELGILKYRFPDVIQWVQGPGRTGERLPFKKGDKVVRVRYKDGDDAITIAVDPKTWLLSGVEIRSAKDTSFVFDEEYAYYTEVEGIPFPEEFTATYLGKPYYDYLLSLIELRSDLPDSLLRVTAEDSMSIAKPEKPAAAAPAKPGSSQKAAAAKSPKAEKAQKPAPSKAGKR